MTPRGGDRDRSGGPKARRSRSRRGRGAGESGTSPTTRAPDTSGRTASEPAGGVRKRSTQQSRNRGRSGPPVDDEAGFWGDVSQLPFAERDVRITDEPSAVPRSLGRPPLPGHEQIAEHYFAAVYDRAVATAGALAAAGGLIDTDELLEEMSG
jgi:hypothetical protein